MNNSMVLFVIDNIDDITTWCEIEDVIMNLKLL